MMWESIYRAMRAQKRLRIVGCIFAVSVFVLFLTNLLVRIFFEHDNLWQLLSDFLLPLLLAVSAYLSGWLHDGVEALLRKARGVRLMAVFAPVAATFLSFLTYWPGYDRVDFGITLFALLSMCVTAYSLENMENAYMAILGQTVWFVLLAAQQGNNAAAMVTIPLTAAVLLIRAPENWWRWQFGDRKKTKIALALGTLLLAMFVLLRIRSTGVLDAFALASLGRPGLGSSAWFNRECAEAVQNAKFFGAMSELPQVGNIFSHRVPTLILAKAGWLAAIPVLLALVTMLGSGTYICLKHKTYRSGFSAVFLTVMAVQTVGYLAMCAGWDELLFPEMCPFLDGGFFYNELFVLIAVWILPSVEYLFPELVEYFTDEEEDAQQEAEPADAEEEE